MAPGSVVGRLVGWATGVVGRLMEWFVGHLGRAARSIGRHARTFLEPLLEPLRLLYAFIAARIGTWILALVLMVVYCVVAAAVAVVLYLFLYHNFVPVIAFHKPIYFDFTRAEPWAVADFADKWSPSGRPPGVDTHHRAASGGGPTVVATPVLSPGHLYDFALDLQLPDSPINDRIGMFMVTLSLYSWNGDLLANSSRPCRVRYRTDLLQKMWTVFWSVPLVLGLMEEKQALRLELLSQYIDTHVAPFGYATVTLSHRELEVYSADLHIEARLSGISYFCYYWFFTAMAVFVPLIFLAETWLIILTWLVIYFLLPAVAPSAAASTAPLAAPRTAPVSPAERRRRIAGIGRANEAAAATAAAAAAPLAGLEELGHEARSPSLPREGDHQRRAQEEEEEEEDDVALQALLEREIARKLKAAEEEDYDDDGEEGEDEEEVDWLEEEDTGAGVFPRLRQRRPRRWAAAAAAQREGATRTPPTTDDEDDGDVDERTSKAAATTPVQAAEPETVEDKTKVD